MQKYEFLVTGMSCGHCKKRVEKASSAQAGVTSVEVNLATGNLMVISDREIDIDAMIHAIDEAGYDASLKQS